MIFDDYGLPRDTGATDMMDSARLAGMMAVVKHSQAPFLYKYVLLGLGYRHPYEFPACNPWNFSRDQLMPLACGLYFQKETISAFALYNSHKSRKWKAQNIEHDKPGSKKKFPNGPDWISFSNRLVLAKCAGVKTTFLFSTIGYCWLLIDILFNALFSQHKESNQLIANLIVMGPFWVRLYKAITPGWEKSILDYWTGWRGEPELAQMLIDKIKSY